MLQNVYFLAKIGADTAENEQNFAEICQPTLSDVSASEGPAEDLEVYSFAPTLTEHNGDRAK